MNDLIDDELFLQIEEHLKCSEQSWLLGAGISFDAKLPLMYPLTNKVSSIVSSVNDASSGTRAMICLTNATSSMSSDAANASSIG